MTTESLRLSATFPVSPERLYRAWLDSREHAQFTGGEAEVDPVVGGAHSAWDGYIWGRILDLEPGHRIVQTWRTSEFPPGSEDSHVEIVFDPVEGGTRVTVIHTDIPDGQGSRYESGWEDFYFDPMRKHFATPAPVPTAKITAKKPAAPKRVGKSPARPKAKAVRKTVKKPVRKSAKKAARRPVRKVARKAAARSTSGRKKVAKKKVTRRTAVRKNVRRARRSPAASRSGRPRSRRRR